MFQQMFREDEPGKARSLLFITICRESCNISERLKTLIPLLYSKEKRP